MANIAKLVNENKMEIWFDFDWDRLNLVKSLPGREFKDNKRGKYWIAPISAESVEKLDKAGFEISPELKTLNLVTKQIPVTIEKEIEIPGLKRVLFPFQKEDVLEIEKRNGRILIGSEMGLGKTVQALAWLALHPEKKPVIILCPASLKLNWEQEIQKTLVKKQNVQILSGKTIHKLTRDIIIINYDILSAWVDALIKIKPQVLIFDEAHFVKSSKAIRTKATKKLAKKIPHVIALTGTPIVNRPIEGFNIANIIDKTVFPNFWTYVHTYCGAKHNGFGWDFSGASNKEELHKKLVESIMIRRKKADVLTDLPDKIYSAIPVELSNSTEYDKAEANFINYLKETKGSVVAKKAQQAEHLVRIEALKQLAVQGKMDQAISWIQNFLDGSDEKLVVFATHKTTVNQLMDEFKEIAVKVDGSVSTEKRNEAVQAFQNDPKVKLFVGNIQAAGVGLTLTAASSVVFLELPWTPGELAQATDRCHRIGQKNSVNVYYLLASGTIEEDIAELLDEKRKVLEAVLDGKEVEETGLLTELLKKYSGEGR